MIKQTKFFSLFKYLQIKQIDVYFKTRMVPQSVRKTGIIYFENGILTIKNGTSNLSFQTTNFFSIKYFGKFQRVDPIKLEEANRFNGQKREVMLVPIPQSAKWGDNNRKKPYPYNAYITI